MGESINPAPPSVSNDVYCLNFDVLPSHWMQGFRELG